MIMLEYIIRIIRRSEHDPTTIVTANLELQLRSRDLTSAESHLT